MMADSRSLHRSKSDAGKGSAELIGKPSLQVQSQSAKERKKRVKSAKLNREKQNSSTKVFPRPQSAEKKERYTSIYNKDFEGSYIPPTEPRPTSPTRRNNPHPSQQFIVWRVPSREIGAQSQPVRMGSGLPGPRRLSGSGQYEDSEFDEFETYDQYERMRVPLPEPSSKDYGAYLRQMRAAAALQKGQGGGGGYGDRVPSRQSQRGGDYYGGQPGVHYVGPDVLSRTLKNEGDSGVAEWMKTASSKEQQTIAKMLKEAENAQVKQTIHSVMQPEAANYVKGWMKSANDEERDVAVRLFSSLGSRQGPRRQRSLSESAIRPPSRIPSKEEHRLSNPTVDGKPWPKSLWHHLPVRDPPPRVYHRGSLFGKGGGGASHFNIHPEWPDYDQPTFTQS